MTEILTYLCYVTEIFLLNYIDYKYFKSLFNPFFFLSAPFSIILLICLLINRFIGFVQFDYNSLWIWILGLLCFWGGGQIANNIYISLKRTTLNRIYQFSIPKYVLLACLVFSLCIFFSTIGYASFGSKEFGEQIGQGGLVGRSAVCLLVAFPAFVYIFNRPFVKVLSLVLCFIFILALGSKTWTMNVLLATFISYQIINKNKINIKKALLVFIIAIVAFIGYYAVSLGIDSDFFKFVLRHFYFYLTSGTLSMSEFVQIGTFQNTGDHMSFPILSLVRSAISEETPAGHSTIWYTTDLILGTQSNVFTFFGTLYIYNSLIYFILYSLFFGGLSYHIANVVRNNKSIFLVILHAFNLSVLFFGWFNCEYFLTTIWEIFFYCLLFYFISKCRIRQIT